MKKSFFVAGAIIVILAAVIVVLARAGVFERLGGGFDAKIKATVAADIKALDKTLKIKDIEVRPLNGDTAEVHVFYFNSCSDIFTYQKKNKDWDIVDMRPGPDCPSQRNALPQQGSPASPSGPIVEGKGFATSTPSTTNNKPQKNNSDEKAVSEVVNGFYNALLALRFQDLQDFYAPDRQREEGFKIFVEQIDRQKDQFAKIKENKKAVYTVEINGDTTAVAYINFYWTITMKNGEVRIQDDSTTPLQLKLIKINNKWLVSGIY